MQVTATESKKIKVELDDFTVREIVLSQFRTVFNLPIDSYIKDGKLMESIESWGGSHSWWDENTIRDATEEDKAAVLILKKLQQEL